MIASGTQEEVLFSVRPELFVSMLVAMGGGVMQKDEAVVVSGARQYSAYTGYLSTFAFGGATPALASPQQPPPDIVAMDCSVAGAGQYTANVVVRDLNKARVAFGGTCNGSISTGKWGCGVFGGDIALKFILQVHCLWLTRYSAICTHVPCRMV